MLAALLPIYNEVISKDMENNQIPEEQTTETVQEAQNIVQQAQEAVQQPDNQEVAPENAAPQPESEMQKLMAELQEVKDKYLRLYADFENFRRRVAKEKIELTKIANESLILALLPTLDNFERAKKSFQTDQEQFKPYLEGINLIQESLFRTLQNFGVKEIPTSQGDTFNTDHHEAVTQVQMEGMNGKVVEVIEKGYFLDNKVIRFAKVVVGA